MTVSFIYNRSTLTVPCHSSMEYTPIPDSKPEKGENYFKQQSPDMGPDDVEIVYHRTQHREDLGGTPLPCL